jgi:hypothetical protein
MHQFQVVIKTQSSNKMYHKKTKSTRPHCSQPGVWNGTQFSGSSPDDFPPPITTQTNAGEKETRTRHLSQSHILSTRTTSRYPASPSCHVTN